MLNPLAWPACPAYGPFALHLHAPNTPKLCNSHLHPPQPLTPIQASPRCLKCNLNDANHEAPILVFPELVNIAEGVQVFWVPRMAHKLGACATLGGLWHTKGLACHMWSTSCLATYLTHSQIQCACKSVPGYPRSGTPVPTKCRCSRILDLGFCRVSRGSGTYMRCARRFFLRRLPR